MKFICSFRQMIRQPIRAEEKSRQRKAAAADNKEL